MTFPSPSAYQEALQHPEDAFADEELQRATPRTGPLGLPRPATGAFAAVFPMTTPEGRRLAAKCFLAEAPDQQKRYRAVADHLTEAELPYTVGFDYQPEGIRVNGAAFPLLKMDWAEGAPLNRYAEEHLDDPGALNALAEAWAEMLAALEDAGVAHGDLQHGNALVAEGAGEGPPKLRLVDYATTFVPALDGKKSAEVGHRNYQHPDRTEEDFGPHLDRFPGLAVYVALRALARRPALWSTYDTGENLLFRAADFYDPGASPLFAELDEIDALTGEVHALRTACHRAPEALPPLADVRSGIADLSADLSSRTPRTRRRQRTRSTPREGVAWGFAPAGALGAAVAAVLGALVSVVAGGVALALTGATLGGWAARGYRRQPVVRRRRRLQQEQAHFAGQIEALRREEETLREQRRAVRSRREERRAEQLAEVREEALRDRLKHHFIGEVRGVEGLSHKTVVRLKAAGIRTAHEATPEAVESVTRLGPTTTERLHQWRAALVERYAPELPGALSPAQKRRLERYAERRLEQIDEETARTRRKIEAYRAERADAEARAEALPDLSPMRYLRYLLRLDSSLPSPEDAPPAPTAPRPADEPASTAPAPDTEEPPSSTQQQSWYGNHS